MSPINLDHPKACGCAICTGALALEDCASLRIVDVVELRKLMAGVQAGFAQWRRGLAVATGRLPAATAPVFAVPKNLTEQLRKDAAYAGLALEDADGRTLDFHALRATCATLMARAGVPLQLARRLIRHTDVKLTARHYEKLGREDLRAGSQQLADSFWSAPLVAEMAATDLGTEPKADDPRQTTPSEGRRASL